MVENNWHLTKTAIKCAENRFKVWNLADSLILMSKTRIPSFRIIGEITDLPFHVEYFCSSIVFLYPDIIFLDPVENCWSDSHLLFNNFEYFISFYLIFFCTPTILLVRLSLLFTFVHFSWESKSLIFFKLLLQVDFVLSIRFAFRSSNSNIGTPFLNPSPMMGVPSLYLRLIFPTLALLSSNLISAILFLIRNFYFSSLILSKRFCLSVSDCFHLTISTFTFLCILINSPYWFSTTSPSEPRTYSRQRRSYYRKNLGKYTGMYTEGQKTSFFEKVTVSYKLG